MAVGVRLSPTRVLKGEDWDEVENQLRRMQFTVYESLEAFRNMMAWRAKRLSGIEVDTDGSSYSFLSELERGGVLSTIYYLPSDEDIRKQEERNKRVRSDAWED